MLHPLTLWELYRGRWKLEPLPELLAILGIACGVALLFAVQVANRSVTGSFEELAKGIAGRATLEVAARSPEGFDQRAFKRIARLPSVAAAAPVVERRVAVVGASGRRPLTLVGTDDRLPTLGGRLTAGIGQRASAAASIGLYLPASIAESVGTSPGRMVTLEIAEGRRRVPLAGVLSEASIGSLAQSPVAFAPLGLAQKLAGMAGRISRVLVVPVDTGEAKATAELRTVAAGRLNVRPADAEAKLLSGAAAADRQSSGIFAVISVVVGMLLAYTAILLTLPERRRFVASLHLIAAPRRAVVSMLLFELTVVGVVGSVLGIFLGDLLSRFVFREAPSFLAAAFAIGTQRLIEPQTIALAIGAGTLAAIAAGMRPVLDMLRLDPVGTLAQHESEMDDRRSRRAKARLLGAALALIVAVVCVALLIPESTLVGVAVLAVATAMAMPAVVAFLIRKAEPQTEHSPSAAIRVVASELGGSPARATALAAIGAVAIFAILAIAGPARDLERGHERLNADVFGNADIWLHPGLRENIYGTQPFDARQAIARIRRVAGVESVRQYRASHLDVGDRRLYVLAPPRSDRPLIAPTQLLSGNLAQAQRRLRRRGWAALTDALAKQWHVGLGERFVLPTPTGQRPFRLAAMVTSYGWLPGTIVINADDYARAWGTSDASALEVDVAPGVPLGVALAAVRKALGPGSNLRPNTARERREKLAEVSRQALARINQIATIVLLTIALAVAAAMLGAAWERRYRVWNLVSMGMRPRSLYAVFLLEIGVVLLVGGLAGAGLGFLGQALAGRWLASTTGSPVPFSPAFGLALQSLAIAAVIAAVATAIPVRLLFPVRGLQVFSPESSR